MKTAEAHDTAKPFLKWAGGKRQLLPELRKFYPNTFGAYFEPFTGSGAVFFDLHNRGLLRGRKAFLIDNNPDLIGCYRSLRDDPEGVIRQLTELALEYRRKGSDFYYDLRDRQFNPLRARLFATTGDPVSSYTPDLAAMAIFLNRTGFNGLFRLNSRNEFNVPEGRYSNPQICHPENLRRVSRALNQTGVTIQHGHFSAIEALAQSGDFLYFDPPYAPMSKTARFTSYTAQPFGAGEQRRLHALLLDLSKRRCHVVVSNSAAAEIRRLYDSDATRKARLYVHTVRARRAINSKPSARGAVDEYILTNQRAAAGKPR